METKIESFPCDKIIYKYWGKKPKGESKHLLIYHCLDVAAVGHVFLQEYDIILAKMNLATGLDKKESLSLITFYLAMHDLGKFSNRAQNRPYFFLKYHSKMGFHLWSEIWEQIWHDNLFCLDKSSDEVLNWKKLFEPWIESVMHHHDGKYEYPHEDDMRDYFNDEDKTAAYCFIKKSAELLLDNNSETAKKYYDSMDHGFKSKSNLLNDLTIYSDWTASEINRLLFTWDEVPGNDNNDLLEFLIKEFSINCIENGNIEKIDHDRIIRVTIGNNVVLLELNEETTNVNLKIDDGRSAELIAKEKNGKFEIYTKGFEYCSRKMPIREYWDKVAIKQAKNAIESLGELMLKMIIEKNPTEFSEQHKISDENTDRNFRENKDREEFELKNKLEIQQNPSWSILAKTVTSGNLTKKVKISKNNIEENFDPDLFEILRCLRKELADKEGMPPFIIFYDISLKAMATYFPKDLQTLGNIEGVNETDIRKYGELFLEKNVTYCGVNNIGQKTNNHSCFPTKL